ncbi:hypothetical protein GCM10007079_16540 [Nocardiopsis terrae]|uniref:Suppressor of fused protein (SUFU) n=1 Tax=Nocardiopsis terrae TaxID=372655 RepID=A0ABR9HI76_9ACTN|nr:hypothetical protein [Nocardiopsis terrae]MBE1458718.1 hypothetical protein [Nocardiopsis terrae]GHC78888.1 hypothetical protein GCM10007079_16540 [Nocardiopsis terrae]
MSSQFAWDAHEPEKSILASHERDFGGIAFPILGGELQGWVRLGVKSGRVRTTGSGERIFNFADPQFVQCGLVCRMDGRFGVSWGSEFLPWHADVYRLIESSAVWASLAGWKRSALCDGDPSVVLGSFLGSRDEESASPESYWFLGADVAVYVEPHLTYLPEGSSRIHVLTSNWESNLNARKILEELDSGGERFLVRYLDSIVERPGECPFRSADYL